MTPPKAPVVGTPVSLTSYDEVIAALAEPPGDRAATVAVCNVHSVMSARTDERLAKAIAGADIATPDGVPIVWALQWTTDRSDQERVYGPELMRRALLSSDGGLRHYLYGSTPETLDLLQRRIGELAPGADVVGADSPPFRPLTDDEEEAALERIRTSGANVVWIGLGMPKQELWMDSVAPRLPGVTLVGVGAAFDFIAGTKAQAPPWMQKAGLEWLFRLVHEPRRLWRRYIWNNPAYLVLLARQVVTSRLTSRRRGAD
jgi:N-acetylglucosaminyldiphosphoundecaprenol N-acetyl-beta-D-mannosaminyltransferase